MSARKVGDRAGRNGGSEDNNETRAAVAELLRKAHAADPDEVNVAVSELDAQQAYRDNPPSGAS